MSLERVPAVILAGGKAKDALAAHSGVAYKALAPVKERPMVAHVADALRQAGRVSEVTFTGPPEVTPALPGLACVGSADTFIGSVRLAVSACKEADYALLVSCDVPFLTGAVIDTFVAAALDRRADVAYPIVEVARCNERFPGMRRTSLRLREGTFTGGNAVLMSTRFLERNADVIEAAYAARKQPLRLAGMLGWDLVGRLALSKLLPGLAPLPLLEARVGRLMGGKAAAIVMPHPEIGADIDKPEDLAQIG